LEPSAAPPPPRQAAQASPVADLQTQNITLQRHQATQADECPWSFGSVRRQVLQTVLCLTVVEPPPGARDERHRATDMPIREFSGHQCQSCRGRDDTVQDWPRNNLSPNPSSQSDISVLPTVLLTCTDGSDLACLRRERRVE